MKQFLDSLKKWLNKTWNTPEVELLNEPNATLPKHLKELPNWIKSEIDEYEEAVQNGDMIGVLDAVTDIHYLSMQLIIVHGLESVFEEAFLEVHRSNMTKIKNGVQRNEFGKIMKPESYEPPNLEAILAKTPAKENAAEPDYYKSTDGKFQVHDIMYLNETCPAITHALTYAMRLGKKDNYEQELRKIVQWLNILIEHENYNLAGTIGEEKFIEIMQTEGGLVDLFPTDNLGKSIAKKLLDINSSVKYEQHDAAIAKAEKLKWFISDQISARQ